MSFFDLILILIVFGFCWFGFWYGLIYSVGRIISLILGTIFASRWYEWLAGKILPILNNNLNLSRIVAFLVILIVSYAIMFAIFKFLNRIFGNIPVLGTINRLGGGVIGFAEGGLIIGLLLYFSTKFPLWDNWTKLIEDSSVAIYLIKFSKVLLPFLPQALKQIKSVIHI